MCLAQVPEDHYFEYSEINTHTDADVKKGRGKLLIFVIDFLCVQFYLKEYGLPAIVGLSFKAS